jgi:acyl-CoA synthetase (AMP-forming)/AMP-acid ligase II
MSELYSLNHLIAKRVREYPDLQILGIPDKEFNVRLWFTEAFANLASRYVVAFQKYTKYTTAELDASASLLANHSKNHGFLPGRAKGDSTSRLTVGLLGISNIDYVVTEMALYRMGYCW